MAKELISSRKPELEPCLQEPTAESDHRKLFSRKAKNGCSRKGDWSRASHFHAETLTELNQAAATMQDLAVQHGNLVFIQVVRFRVLLGLNI